jgi:hypothetical protein
MGEVYNQPTGGEQPNSSNVQTQIPRDPGGEMGMPGFYIPRYDLPKSVLINPIRQPGIQQPGIQQPVRPYPELEVSKCHKLIQIEIMVLINMDLIPIY